MSFSTKISIRSCRWRFSWFIISIYWWKMCQLKGLLMTLIIIQSMVWQILQSNGSVGLYTVMQNIFCLNKGIMVEALLIEHIDDIILIGDNINENTLKNYLAKEIEFKDLDSYVFLGIELEQSNKGILVSQKNNTSLIFFSPSW